MPCYMVIDGIKQEIDEDLFDEMVEAIHTPPTPPNTPNNTSTRWQPDGSYNKKPLDPDYFTKYYKKKLTTPFNCPDCGRTISSKTNLSKHRQTQVCINNRRH